MTKRSGPTSEENSSPQEAAQGGVQREAAGQGAAAVVTNTTTSATATASSTASEVASPTPSASPGERAASNTASIKDLRSSDLWEINEKDVALPLVILEPFKRWKADPPAFFRSIGQEVPTTLVELYDYALSVHSSTASSSQILWRFITTAYYDTISAQSMSDRYFVDKESIECVVDVICKSPSYNREVVKRKIISWVKEGAKHRTLADKLGDLGCFFFYPEFGEWLWKKYLTKTAYDRAAKLLRDCGIFKKAQQSGAVDLASSIEEILKAIFESAGLNGRCISLQQTTHNAGDGAPPEHTLGKRKRAEFSIAQRLCLPRPVHDSSQSGGFTATPSTTPSQSIDSTLSESQQPPALNHIEPVASAHDQSYNRQLETTQWVQDSSMGLQSQNFILYSAQPTVLDGRFEQQLGFDFQPAVGVRAGAVNHPAASIREAAPLEVMTQLYLNRSSGEACDRVNHVEQSDDESSENGVGATTPYSTPSQVSASSILNRLSDTLERRGGRPTSDTCITTSYSAPLTQGRQEATSPYAVQQIQMPTDMRIADSLLRCVKDYASLMLNEREKRRSSLALRREETVNQQPREDIHRLQTRENINATVETCEKAHYFLKLGESLKAIERLKDMISIVPRIFNNPDLFLLIRIIEIATWSSWKKFPRHERLVFRCVAALASEGLGPEHPLTLLLTYFSKCAAISTSYPTLWTCVIDLIGKMADEQSEAQGIRIKGYFYLIRVLRNNGNHFAAILNCRGLIQLCITIDGFRSFSANRARYNLAVNYCEAGKLEAAMAAYDEVCKYSGTVDDPYEGWVFAVFATNELAQLYEQEGNIDNASHYYEKALIGFLQYGGKDSSGALLMLNDLINFHKRYGHEEQLGQVETKYSTCCAQLSAGGLDDVRRPWVGCPVTTQASGGKRDRAWTWTSPIV